jgi:hypothetical protein
MHSPRRLRSLYACGAVSIRELRRVLLTVWSRGIWPGRKLTRAGWLELFRAAGYLSDSATPQPSRAVQLFRAEAGKTIGLAWTSDAAVAERFHAHNLAAAIGEARLVSRLVQPSAVLATIDQHGESEFVIDPTVRPVRCG